MFAEAATYRVFCNIHPQMSAVIVVAPTPFVTVTDRDGAYTLTLPPGRYRVTATTGRGTPVSHEVTIAGASATLEPIDVDERTLVDAPHTNKFGKPYPRRDGVSHDEAARVTRRDAEAARDRPRLAAVSGACEVAHGHAIGLHRRRKAFDS